VTLSARDKTVLRDLAMRKAEIAALPVQREKARLWYKLNRLERVRPLVLLYNLTWKNKGGTADLELQTESDFARSQEWELRERLYHWDHMRDDHVYDDVIYCQIVDTEKYMFHENHYGFVVEDDAEPDIAPAPIKIDWDGAERKYQQMCELYDGILTVKKRGEWAYGSGVLDHWTVWRGMDKCFVDLVERPEWVHRWLAAMTQWHIDQLKAYEREGYLWLNNGNNPIDPGGMGFSDELPQPDFDGSHVRSKDMWGMTASQIFSVVSPAMHDEFGIAHDGRFLEQFGLTGYGCCEPLHDKLDIVKKIPHLRRISMSPWADLAKGAEGIGTDYVFSCKPNPSLLGGETWDLDHAREQLRDALDKTRGCIVEVVMKDLHFCHGEPHRLWQWVEMAMQLAREYA